MIKKFEPKETNDVLDIWLTASIQAHRFVDKEFWESKVDDMREIYIPSSETYVFQENNIVKGFFSLHGETLAAMFVSPEFQHQGIGRKMIEKAKTLRSRLNLTVYKENTKSTGFYKNCGFEIIEEKIDEHTGHTEFLMKFHPSNRSELKEMKIEMSPKEVVTKFVQAFNEADSDLLASLYAESAINHQVAEQPVEGREAIRKMFERGFAEAEMTCIVENLFEDGEWAILEWRDPLGLRGCGFFHVVDSLIVFQRGYWDKLTFLRQHGLQIPSD
jgi:GNAT superfamily N-acetyltransferase/limonene-1,2-epoxide hydrolase